MCVSIVRLIHLHTKPVFPCSPPLLTPLHPLPIIVRLTSTLIDQSALGGGGGGALHVVKVHRQNTQVILE